MEIFEISQCKCFQRKTCRDANMVTKNFVVHVVLIAIKQSFEQKPPTVIKKLYMILKEILHIYTSEAFTSLRNLCGCIAWIKKLLLRELETCKSKNFLNQGFSRQVTFFSTLHKYIRPRFIFFGALIITCVNIISTLYLIIILGHLKKIKRTFKPIGKLQ